MSGASGTVDIDFTSLDLTGNTLLIFNEQYNGDKLADYASEPQAVTIPTDVNAYDITNTLTNLSTSNAATYRMKNETENYTATLSAESGYALPESISVSVGGTSFTGHGYTKAAPNITIPSDNINGDIVISAAGRTPVAPTITTSSLPEATVGTAYNATLEATGDATITWSLKAGNSLPAGLSLDSTGVISGTPTTEGTSTFTVVASNGVDPAAEKELSINVNPAPSITDVFVTPATANVQKGTSQQFTADVSFTGVIDNSVTWSVDGADASGTVISSDGLLSVDANETAASLTVKATAKADSTKVGTATVTVTAIPITKYSLTVVNGTGDGDYESGAVVNIVADAPAAGKRFKNWTSTDGGSFADANSAATRFTMPANNVTVTANYEDIPAANYTITVSASPEAGGTVSGGGSFAANASVNVTAMPNSGYRFVRWTENDGVVSMAATYSFTVTKSRNLVAVFEAVPSVPTGGVSSGIGSGYIAPAQNSAGNAKGDIRISGMNIPSGDALITTPTQNSVLLKLLGGNTLIGMWDIKLQSGRTSIPGSTLSFNVGRENAGKVYTLYHLKADGTVESFSAVANAQGIVSFYPVGELSPFMLVQGGGITTTSILEVPATGDVNVGLALMLLSAIMAAAVVIKRRKAQA